MLLSMKRTKLSREKSIRVEPFGEGSYYLLPHDLAPEGEHIKPNHNKLFQLPVACMLLVERTLQLMIVVRPAHFQHFYLVQLLHIHM